MNKYEKFDLKDYLKEKEYETTEINIVFKILNFFEDSYFYKKSIQGITNYSVCDLKLYINIDTKLLSIILRNNENETEITLFENYIDNLEISDINFILTRVQRIVNNFSEINKNNY